MISQESEHPSSSTLHAFSLGQLPTAERNEIEKHLENCHSCCEVLTANQIRDDRLLELARQANATPFPEPPPPAEVQIPPELQNHSRYRILAPLGEGGMGMVFKAEHKLMDRVVTLKVIHGRLLDNPEAIERFRLEVRAAAKLSHPNIVTAYDAEQAGNLHFLVMEYVEGISLDRFIARQKRPLTAAY